MQREIARGKRIDHPRRYKEAITKRIAGDADEMKLIKSVVGRHPQFDLAKLAELVETGEPDWEQIPPGAGRLTYCEEHGSYPDTYDGCRLLHFTDQEIEAFDADERQTRDGSWAEQAATARARLANVALVQLPGEAAA